MTNNTDKTYFSYDYGTSAHDGLYSASSVIAFIREVMYHDELTMSVEALEGLNVILRSAQNAINTANEHLQNVAGDSYKRGERLAKDEYVRGELDGYAKALFDLKQQGRITWTDQEKERCNNSIAKTPETRKELDALRKTFRDRREADGNADQQVNDTFPKLKENSRKA